MIALAYLAAGAVYFSIMFYAVAIAWRWGRQNAATRTRAFVCATLAFLAIYLPLFWDHIPTLVAHRYYCGKDGGVVIRREASDWKRDHAHELADLAVPPGGLRDRVSLSDGWRRHHRINMLISYEQKNEAIAVIPGIEVIGEYRRLVDLQAGEVLAQITEYSSGKSFQAGNLKFWMEVRSCGTQYSSDRWWDVEREFRIERGTK